MNNNINNMNPKMANKFYNSKIYDSLKVSEKNPYTGEETSEMLQLLRENVVARERRKFVEKYEKEMHRLGSRSGSRKGV